jgi:hypothetical protein
MKEVQEAFTETGWFKDDPRWHIDKRADIVILVKGLYNYNETILADVDTKEVYDIFFHGKLDCGKTWLSADEDWPENWVWTYVPWEK